MLFANKSITSNSIFFARVFFSNGRMEMEKRGYVGMCCAEETVPVFALLLHESSSDALESYFILDF